MARSLQSMLVKASTLGHSFNVVSEGDVLYCGKNPRDAFQIIRDLDEVSIDLVDEEGVFVDWAFIVPGDSEAYICDCNCDGFFDNWEI